MSPHIVFFSGRIITQVTFLKLFLAVFIHVPPHIVCLIGSIVTLGAFVFIHMPPNIALEV